MIQQPDGIIITISEQMIKEKGYRNWLRNFLDAMGRFDGDQPWTYWMKQGAKPTKDFLYVYLSVKGKIRFRCTYVQSYGSGEMKFGDGATMFARAWVVMAGPLIRPEHPVYTMEVVGQKGFRGFRYCQKLF